MREGEALQNLQFYIKDELELLKKTNREPDAIQRYRGSVGAFEFFEKHPQLLDPDLRQLIDLDFLIKDAYEAQRLGKEAFSKVAKRVRELEKQSNFSSLAGALSVQRSSASATPLPKRPKSPSQTPASPSPGGRRKRPKSIAASRRRQPPSIKLQRSTYISRISE